MIKQDLSSKYGLVLSLISDNMSMTVVLFEDKSQAFELSWVGNNNLRSFWFGRDLEETI